MSNLIITIIAIALVAVVALAAVFYGSSSWQRGQDQARATTLLNQKEQIRAASALYKSTVGKGEAATSLQQLEDAKFIAVRPAFETMEWVAAGDKVYVTIPADVDADSVCAKAYKEEYGGSGSYTIGPCSSVGSDDVCCYVD